MQAETTVRRVRAEEWERLRFHATGATEPLPHAPSVREHHMACALEQWRSV